jgi:hypothetical protein
MMNYPQGTKKKFSKSFNHVLPILTLENGENVKSYFYFTANTANTAKRSLTSVLAVLGLGENANFMEGT